MSVDLDTIIWHTQRANCSYKNKPCTYCGAATTTHAQLSVVENFFPVCDRLSHGRCAGARTAASRARAMKIPLTTRRNTAYRAPQSVVIHARRTAKTAYDQCDCCGVSVNGTRSVLTEYHKGRRLLPAVFDLREGEEHDILCYVCFRALTPGNIVARLLTRVLL